MTPRDYVRELTYPATSSGTLVVLATFTLLGWLAANAGVLGLWLAIVVVPAYLRYLTMIAEARARDAEAAPPGIEYFTLVGNVWTLFPVIPVVLAGLLVGEAMQAFGAAAAQVTALAGAFVFPAHIGVLVITHSPLQSIDPRALFEFIRGCGASYAYAPLTAVLVVVAPTMLGQQPAWLRALCEIYLLAAFFGVVGAVTRGAGLIDAIDLPGGAEPDPDQILTAEAADRVRVLNHAYGFVSRGNRDGGLRHVRQWLERDPDPDNAWPWFVAQMLAWQDSYPGLLLAQHYLGRLLARGDPLAAVKLMLRCRLVDEAFRPRSADLEQAIAAAESRGNSELAAELSRGR